MSGSVLGKAKTRVCTALSSTCFNYVILRVSTARAHGESARRRMNSSDV